MCKYIYCNSCDVRLSDESVHYHGKNNTPCCGDEKCKSLIDLNDKTGYRHRFFTCVHCGEIYGIALEDKWEDEGYCSIECALKSEYCE